MSKREELLALAERVEAATGADRELECRAWCAVGAAGVSYEKAVVVVPDYDLWLAPRYTESLDAAMGLVEDGHQIGTVWHHSEREASSVVGPNALAGFPLGEGKGRGLKASDAQARAITAAALRARAAMETDNGG